MKGRALSKTRAARGQSSLIAACGGEQGAANIGPMVLPNLQNPPPSAPAKSGRGAAWGWAFGLLAFLWFLTCRNLAIHWSANPVYSYGWLVPWLAIYAAYLRWKTRPAPVAAGSAGRWLIGGGALLFLPTWVFLQPNPDWSLISWALTGEVVAITLGMVACAGGPVWILHFAFPVCFILVAVPCPHVIEIPLTQGLMRWVAALTVDLLNLTGMAAVQHGNLLEVQTGWLGVDEACSGVRSLQASLMASLFSGELYRFSTRRRLLLLLIGLGTALTTNVARTYFLGWNASRTGLATIEKWHDPAGFSILAVCFLSVWAAAHLLEPRRAPIRAFSAFSSAGRIPSRVLAGLALWFTFALAGTELWFRGSGVAPRSTWRSDPPPSSTPVEITRAAADQLQCDYLNAAAWREPDGAHWVLYFLEWRPGPIHSRVLARVHRPEVCLSAVGMKMLANRGEIEVEAAGHKIAVSNLHF